MSGVLGGRTTLEGVVKRLNLFVAVIIFVAGCNSAAHRDTSLTTTNVATTNPTTTTTITNVATTSPTAATTRPVGPTFGQPVTLTDNFGTVRYTVTQVGFTTTRDASVSGSPCQDNGGLTLPPAYQFEALEFTVQVVSGSWQEPTEWTQAIPDTGQPGDTQDIYPGHTSFDCALSKATGSSHELTPADGPVTGWVIFMEGAASSMTSVEVTIDDLYGGGGNSATVAVPSQ